jgi:hypothetical protein
MREKFIERKFSPASKEIIVLVNLILSDYESQGFRLTLRQLYYQLVSRAYIPNTVRSYKNLGNLVSDARQAGLIDWYMIEDRGRYTSIPSHWRNPGEIIDGAAASFRTDPWIDQPYHIEVMVEKDALSGVLDPICRKLDVGITANKGYSSSSTTYNIAKRIYYKQKAGKKICVLYLGDHDPSGIDMTRDVKKRLQLYSGIDDIEVVRLALNWDQIEMWKPPENPAKETDARFEAYAAEFGTSSWELDAVEPKVLADLVKDIVLKRIDVPKWKAAKAREKAMRLELKQFAAKYVSGTGKN